MTAPAEHKAANTRTGKTERGQSCKRGCLMQFTVSQLAAWPEVTRIIGRHFYHVNAAGVCCHGPEADGVSSKFQRAPHLSVKTRGWVRTLLSAGISTKEIMRKHQKLPLQVAVEAAAKPAPAKCQPRQQRCMECKACLNRATGKQGCERNKAKRLAEQNGAVQQLDV
ncbi:hypothetical protein ABBQ38_001769 [Trebouxia sp. C0009 RCD-2024]